MPIERDIYFLKRFGKNLKYLRKKKKISQIQLAFEANIETSQISRIEQSKINTTLLTLNAISNILDIPLKDLFDFEE